MYEDMNIENIESFLRRMNLYWESANENPKQSVDLQAKYCNRKYKDIELSVGDLALLSTRNLRMKEIPEELKKKFVGPFRVE